MWFNECSPFAVRPKYTLYFASDSSIQDSNTTVLTWITYLLPFWTACYAYILFHFYMFSLLSIILSSSRYSEYYAHAMMYCCSDLCLLCILTFYSSQSPVLPHHGYSTRTDYDKSLWETGCQHGVLPCLPR
jgi:hypothetical protein